MGPLNRKEFLSVLAAAAALPLVASACGGDDSSGDATDGDATDGQDGDCLANGTMAVISSNHGHVLTVSVADVEAGVMKTYDITGTADHTHRVTLSADHFASLQGNSSITVQSTSGGEHTHAVTVNCA